MGDVIKINYLNFDEGEINSKYYVFSGYGSNIKDIFRPGHADYTYWTKYGIHDY